MNVLLGVTGSVAAILTPQLVKNLLSHSLEVQIVATESSLHFWDVGDVVVFRDKDEWPASGYKRDDKVLHIELRKWADLLLVAPLSANTLAKMATGQADNLLTNVVRAWDRDKTIIVAPAMNTYMWYHPATDEHLGKLRRWIPYPRFQVINPVIKTLACGDEGIGAMAPIENIVEVVLAARRLLLCAP